MTTRRHVYTTNASDRLARLSYAYIAASNAGDEVRVEAVRKAFWRLNDETRDPRFNR